MVGSTPAGYLPILFGHNANIAWSATAGSSDMVDVFVETLDPARPSRYLFKGEWREMQSREEVFHVKGSGDIKATFYSTVHGPVMSIDNEHHRAYSRGRGWAGLEIQSMAAWIESTQSSSFEEFLDASHREALSINWFYADGRGHIGYAHNGRYPVRNPAQDLRLPASGIGDREWQGFLPADQNPHVYNPAQGFLANWNNQPAQGWFFAGGIWASVDRARTLIDFLEARQAITLSDVRELNRHAAFADTTWPFFRARLLDAIRKIDRPDPAVLRAADLLANGMDLANPAMVPASSTVLGVLIFRTWLKVMLADTFGEDTAGPASAMLQFMPGDTPFGSKLLLRVLTGRARGTYLRGTAPSEAMAAAFQKAVAQLTADMGPDPSGWRAPWNAGIPKAQFSAGAASLR